MLVATFLPTVMCAAVWYWFIREPPKDAPAPAPAADTKSTAASPSSGGHDRVDASDVAAADEPAGSFGNPVPITTNADDPGSTASGDISTEPDVPVNTDPEGTFVAAAPNPQPSDRPLVRRPVPDDDALESSKKQIRELFRDKFTDARTPALKHALAAELYELGMATDEDPAAQYMLLLEAIDLAVEVGDFSSALRTIGDIGVVYEVDRVALALEVVQEATSVVHLPTESARLTEACMMLSEFALEDSQFDAAELCVRIANTNATRSKIPGLRLGVTQMKLQVAERETAWKAAEEARMTLESTPDDPAANEQLGQWLCFVQDDWRTGRTHLLYSDDALLRTAVSAEVTAPFSADDRMKVAEKWLLAAETRSGLDQARFQLRASHWFQLAAELTSGLKAARLQQQIDDVDRDALGSERTWLSELQPAAVSLLKGWGLGIGRVGNHPKHPRDIFVNGKAYRRGLGTHPRNDTRAGFVRYVLDSKYRTLALQCAINGSSNDVRGETQFSVIGDGKLLWWSRRVNKKEIVQNCQISVRGIRVLELHVAVQPQAYGAQACWLDPYLLKSEPPKGLSLH